MSRGLGSGSNPNGFSRFGSGSGLQEFHIPGSVRVRDYDFSLFWVRVRVQVKKKSKNFDGSGSGSGSVLFVHAFKLTIKMAAQKARFTEDFRLI